MNFHRRRDLDEETTVVIAASLSAIIISALNIFGPGKTISFFAVPVVVILAARFVHSGPVGIFQTNYIITAIGVITIVAAIATFL